MTSRYLASLPLREQFRTRITELWNYPEDVGADRRGGRLFYQKNTGSAEAGGWSYLREPGRDPVVVLDPNTLSPDGTPR